MSKQRFKNQTLQTVYEWFLANDPGPATRGRGASHNAYFVGRYHSDFKRPFAVRGSAAYAAWAAGVENARRYKAESA